MLLLTPELVINYKHLKKRLVINVLVLKFLRENVCIFYIL